MTSRLDVVFEEMRMSLEKDAPCQKVFDVFFSYFYHTRCQNREGSVCKGYMNGKRNLIEYHVAGKFLRNGETREDFKEKFGDGFAFEIVKRFVEESFKSYKVHYPIPCYGCIEKFLEENKST